MKKHPAPLHLRPKVNTRESTDKKLGTSQGYLSGQAVADPQKKLTAEATALAAARQALTDKLAEKADIQAQVDLIQGDLVLAIDAHDTAMKEYAVAAAKLAGDDASLLATLGVEAAKKSPKGANDVVDAPAKLIVSPGKSPGEVQLSCGAVAYAGSYVFEYKLEPSQPADPWVGSIQTKHVSTTVTGLPQGQAVRARARAIGGIAGPWSAEAIGQAK